MKLHRADRRLIALIGATVLLVAVAFAALAAWGLIRYRTASNFPGAVQLADRSIYRVNRYLIVRRDTTYVTAAPFNEVYKWYSSTFHLGPEQHAMGGCILLAASNTTLAVFDTDVAVTVCDTPSGRMVFVTHSLALRLR